MSVQVIHDPEQRVACLICNTSDTALSPLFHGEEAKDDAQSFLAWVECGAAQLASRDLGFHSESGTGRDPRDWKPHHLEVLALKWYAWNRRHECTPDESGGLAEVFTLDPYSRRVP